MPGLYTEQRFFLEISVICDRVDGMMDVGLVIRVKYLSYREKCNTFTGATINFAAEKRKVYKINYC